MRRWNRQEAPRLHLPSIGRKGHGPIEVGPVNGDPPFAETPEDLSVGKTQAPSSGNHGKLL